MTDLSKVIFTKSLQGAFEMEDQRHSSAAPVSGQGDLSILEPVLCHLPAAELKCPGS